MPQEIGDTATVFRAKDMTSGFDESQLTAYALGELSGAERAEVAAYLAAHEWAREFVAEVRVTANTLFDELARENVGGLSELQHASIEEKLDEMMCMPQVRRQRGVRRERMMLVMSLAASILIVGGVISVVTPFIERRVQSFTKLQRETPPPNNPIIVPFKMDSRYAEAGTTLPKYQPDTTQPSHREYVATDDVIVAAEDELPPQPDDHLVNSGSWHDDTLPIDIGPIVVDPTHHSTPTRSVEVTHGHVGNGTDTGPDQNLAVRPPGLDDKKRDIFLSLPPDQRAPEKDHPTSLGNSGSSTAHDAYSPLLENPFVLVAKEPVSGFSAGVDTASYSNIRRFLTHGKLPPKDAVRIEEMLNYFPVHNVLTPGNAPLEMQVEVGACPWKPNHRLARVCLQARELPPITRPPVNLVFIVDISKSMRSEKTKLPLLKQAMRMLVSKLSPRDQVAIIAYSHEPGIVLLSTSADNKQAIWAALDRLELGGQIRGGQGMELAYDLASRAFVRGGVNRVILATDGNWNIGVTNAAALPNIIQKKSGDKISLTVLGVGMSNLNDATLQKIAAAGNGSYAYIDTLDEAKKVLVDQVNGALVAMARDVKVHVTFDASAADRYRLIGYERRSLSGDELKNQSKRGGEMGAGQSVTALYEVMVTGKTSAAHPGDLLTATVTYSDPANAAIHTFQTTGEDRGTPVPRTSSEFRFFSAVAEFGLLLRDSDYKGNATYSGVLNHALEAPSFDDAGYRWEFIKLIRKAEELSAGR